MMCRVNRLLMNSSRVIRMFCGMMFRLFRVLLFLFSWVKFCSSLLGFELIGRKVSSSVVSSSRVWLILVSIVLVWVWWCGDRLSVLVSVRLLGCLGESRVL